jgi:hypothetical protein
VLEDNNLKQVFYSHNGGGGNNGNGNNNNGNNGNECPEGCCTGNEILCVSIPCPIDIVLLGLQLRLELPCIRLTSQGDTPLGEADVQQLIRVLTGILGNLGNLGGGTSN